MSVFPDIEMEWKGKTYRVRPTMAILRRIEMQGVSIAQFLVGLSGGAPQMFVAAFIVAELLKSAKADATDLEVLEFLNSSDPETAIKLMTQLATALMPGEESLPGKPVASGKRKPKTKARK